VGVSRALPIFAWEVTLAVWLIVKGFNPSAFVSDFDKTDINERNKERDNFIKSIE
jgi:hypothetical protein